MLIKWRRSGLRHREHAVRVFYVMLLALPFGALALLSLFALLGVLAVAGAVYVAGVVAAGSRYVASPSTPPICFDSGRFVQRR
jgi:hypothetical protein